MKGLGTVTSVVILAAGAVAIVVLVRSLPDVKRYLEIRRM